MDPVLGMAVLALLLAMLALALLRGDMTLVLLAVLAVSLFSLLLSFGI